MQPDPRYDYAKLTAFIDGVNSVVPVSGRLCMPTDAGQILKFHGGLRINTTLPPRYELTYRRDEHGVAHVIKNGKVVGVMTDQGLAYLAAKPNITVVELPS